MRKTRPATSLLAALLLSAPFATADAPANSPATQPTMTKLLIEATDVNEAAKQITRQLGLTVQLDPAAVPMQVDGGGDKPFAQAVVELFKQGEVTIAENRSPLWLTKQKPAYVGAVNDLAAIVIQRVNVEAFKAVAPEYASNARFNYTIFANVLTDPALRVLGLMNDSRADAVQVDAEVAPQDNGPPNIGYQISNALNNGQSAGQVQIRFATQTQATAIKGFSARLKAVQILEDASVDVGIESAGQPVAGQGLTGELNLSGGGGGNNRQAVFTLKISGPILEKYRNGNWFSGMNRFVTLEDINGETLAVQNMGSQPGPDGKSVVLRFRPPNNNPAFFDELAVVKVRVPTKVKIVDFPIEVKDVNLPVK